MRKLSIVLLTAASLALVVGAAAAPALAEVRFGINIGPPSYYTPSYGNYYGYNSQPYYDPYHGNYPNRGYNTYSYPYSAPNSAPYSGRYNRHYYPGYYER